MRVVGELWQSAMRVKGKSHNALWKLMHERRSFINVTLFHDWFSNLNEEFFTNFYSPVFAEKKDDVIIYILCIEIEYSMKHSVTFINVSVQEIYVSWFLRVLSRKLFICSAYECSAWILWFYSECAVCSRRKRERSFRKSKEVLLAWGVFKNP